MSGFDAGASVGYFGFGSLVNEHTLRTDYLEVVPASLNGWRRHWQARTDTLEEDIALLSIHRDPGCTILGMLVVDRMENLALVDEREAGYTRHRLELDALEFTGNFQPPEHLFVYVADEAQDVSDNGALLQSYLDAVMQGFHNVYGEDGVHHFVETTAKFDRTLIADRQAPRYPRSVILESGQPELFDRALSRVVVPG